MCVCYNCRSSKEGAHTTPHHPTEKKKGELLGCHSFKEYRTLGNNHVNHTLFLLFGSDMHCIIISFGAHLKRGIAAVSEWTASQSDFATIFLAYTE